MLALLLLALAQDKSSEQILAEAEQLMADAKALFESGKSRRALQEVVDAGFKADEARVKYQAVQQISSGENQRRAGLGIREANQLIKMVNDARVGMKPADPPPPPPPPAEPGAPPPPPPPPPPPAPPERKPPAGPVFDLLRLVSAEKDVVEGRWMVQPGKVLLMEKRGRDADWPRVEFPYLPPEEYDLRVAFRHSGNGEIYLLLAKGGTPFAFEMGGGGNGVFALRGLKPPAGDPGAALLKKPRCLDGARSYTALVEVRNDGVRAYLDDLLIVYASAAPAPGFPEGLGLRKPAVLGLAGGNQAVITGVEIVELKGRGKPAR